MIRHHCHELLHNLENKQRQPQLNMLNIQPKWFPFALYPQFLFPVALAFNHFILFPLEVFSGIGFITKVGALFFSAKQAWPIKSVSWNLRSKACFTDTALACHVWEVWPCGAVVGSLFGDDGNILEIRNTGMKKVSYHIPTRVCWKFLGNPDLKAGFPWGVWLIENLTKQHADVKKKRDSENR